MTPRRIVSLAAVMIVLAGTGAATAARPSLALNPSAVRPGQQIVIRGNADGCPVGDMVTVISRAFAPRHEFAGVPAVLAKVRSGGAFRATTRIPYTRRHGSYVVTARCGGGNLGVARHLVVR